MIEQPALPLPPLPPQWGPGTGPYDLPGLNYYAVIAPRRPRVWTVFVAFIAALIVGNGLGALVLLTALFLENRAQPISPAELPELLQAVISQLPVLAAVLLATQAVFFGTALLGGWLSPTPIADRLRLRRSTVHWMGYPLLMLGGAAIGFLTAVVVQYLGVKEGGTLKMIGDALHHLSPMEVVAAVLLVGGTPAFGEEWLFRGYMQTRLSRRWGRWAAIAITAALFGFAHFDPIQSPFAAIFGVYIGYLAERSGSLRPTMACHFFNNGLQVVMGRYLGDWNPGPIMSACAIAVAITILLASILYMWLGIPPAPPPEVRQPPTSGDVAAPYPSPLPVA